MAEQKAKTIRELDGFEEANLSINDYLIVATNSSGPNMTRKATLEEIFAKYTALQTSDEFGELADGSAIRVISEGGPVREGIKGSEYVFVRHTMFFHDGDVKFDWPVLGFFQPGATIDIDGDQYEVVEYKEKGKTDCKTFGENIGECTSYYDSAVRLKITPPLARTYKALTIVEGAIDYVKEVEITKTESGQDILTGASKLYDGALDEKSKVQKLKGDPTRVSTVSGVTYDMSQISSYNLQDYVDATANGSGLQVVYDCYDLNGNHVDCASGAVSIKSKRLSMIGYTGEIVNNVTMSNSETIVSAMVEDLQQQGEIDTPTFQINKFVLPKQISELENGIVVNSQYYIGAFLEYSGYVGGKWYVLKGGDQFPDLGYGLFFMDNAYDPDGTWMFFAEPQSWFYLPSKGITAPASFDQPYIGWWMWNDDLQWHWTNPNIYPFAYVHGYFKGTQDLVGWIYFETKESTSTPGKQFSRTGKIYIYDTTSGNGSRSKWVNLNNASFDPTTPAVSGPTVPTLTNAVKNAFGTDAPVVVVPAR